METRQAGEQVSAPRRCGVDAERFRCPDLHVRTEDSDRDGGCGASAEVWKLDKLESRSQRRAGAAWMRNVFDARIFMSGPKIPTVMVAAAPSPAAAAAGRKAFSDGL